MPVVKGGVWTNIEDEILKASVSKYGLNQWARVSSLLARKSAKQCKARWTEWLDPAIRKLEWSKEEDEKLLHLAKLMPTQWRTIAPIVGRTATQCLERYQKLLDEAEQREDDLRLGGPEGGETQAPTGDDVRKLRPGEMDPDPESKPARPDTIDLDEDEKEMLSEARARLANTQGKKAKRKARERQLEESRRLALLQKRRELKNAGINIKINHKKKGQMDYNADVPFEHAPASGFYDTLDEQAANEDEREAFDPRRQQLARKRQGDQEDNGDQKRQKKGKDEGPSSAAAAAKAGQMQMMREREQMSKRRALNLPAPQVSDAEMEDIVKMGMSGERAVRASGEDDRGLVSQYGNSVGVTPLRTPRAPAQEDHIANSIRDIRALTETQSSLLGGENTPLHEGAESTGFDGIQPRSNQMVTPNPMATPYRQAGPNGAGPGATPLRTPRDNYALNELDQRALVVQTPKDVRMSENATRQALRAKLASLPRPKATEFELEELPSEVAETTDTNGITQEDQDEIDRREQDAVDAAAAADFKRQSSAYQRSLPRPKFVDYTALTSSAADITDLIEASIAAETALLMANDIKKHPLPNSKLIGRPQPLSPFSDDLLTTARASIDAECNDKARAAFLFSLEAHYRNADLATDMPASLSSAPVSDYQRTFHSVTTDLEAAAEIDNKIESTQKKYLKGYEVRAKSLRQKIQERYEQCQEQGDKLEGFRNLKVGEEAGLEARLERLREEVGLVARREREAQEEFREVKEGLVNGDG